MKGAILGRRITDRDQLRWQPNVRERLFPSLTKSGDSLNVGHNVDRDRGKLWFKFGSKAPGAKNHQEGTGRPPRWAWPWLVERSDLSRFDGKRVRNARVPYTTPKREILTIGARTRGRFEQSATAWAAQWQAEIGLRTAEISETTIATT